ncbi:MAG: GTPase HflX, partial [Terriglobia bacterium]
PTVRSLALPSHRSALLSDTVGFIRELPAHLVASFRATLEELDSADLLLHVIDASHPDWPGRRDSVETLLETMGLASVPRVRVWNKIDQMPEAGLRRIPAGPRDAAVSARTHAGIPDLLLRIDQALPGEPVVEAEFDLPSTDGDTLARLYRVGRVTSTRFSGQRVLVRAQVPESVKIQLKSHYTRITREP